MNILFVHQNFPGQFRYLAPALAARGDQVVAMGMRDFAGAPGIRFVRSRVDIAGVRGGHPWTRDLDAKVIRGQASLAAARALDAEHFVPDIIIAHPGWGESLFLKEIWPRARLGLYCEFHYAATGADLGFDPEFPVVDPIEAACRISLRNLNSLLHIQIADQGISPTYWQASRFPGPFRQHITVVHDGIDTDAMRPDSGMTLCLGDSLSLGPKDEVITFVSRNLEPYRGYHVFLRALPELLARRPRAHVLIVGGDATSYGAPPPEGKTWKGLFFDEVRDRIDQSRVHFLGRVPYGQYRALLQRSSVHVYLTYPFVLSWSLMEAMAAGCAIAASDTAPVREMIRDGETGRLFPFFAGGALVEQVCALLDSPDERKRLGANARAFVRDQHDLRRICLPRQLAWIDKLAG